MSDCTIYDMQTAHIITEGLQSQAVCDATLITAREIARNRGHSVVVEDYVTGRTFRVTRNGRVRRAPAGWDAGGAE